jgi:hypothetical protein
MPGYREFPPIDCPEYNNCLSDQCPLNPSHDVEDILPSNKCRISVSLRLRIMSTFEHVYLAYDGRTRDEYHRKLAGLRRAVEDLTPQEREGLLISPTFEKFKMVSDREATKRVLIYIEASNNIANLRSYPERNSKKSPRAM